MSYLLSYCGDDFTGSTDVMEVLSLAGISTVLLLEMLPREEVKQLFPEAQAIGLATTCRAMSPNEMDSFLPSVFAYLKALDAKFIHYKICSTFDSSPERGSLGKALEIGLEMFESRPVPIVVGAPALKRYVSFGNLFATVGTETYRLDRHPTMSQHPATPMHESDLRRHLAEQTACKVDLIDLHELDVANDLSLADRNCDAVLFDTLSQSHLETIGKVLSQSPHHPQFWLGSSGMEYALTDHLKKQDQSHCSKNVTEVKQILVMSGSASPVTEAQINWAEANGYVSIRLRTSDLLGLEKLEAYAQTTINFLKQGENVILYTAKGPNDPAIKQSQSYMQEQGFDIKATGQILGKQLGKLLSMILEQQPLPRVCVAGGDTSGYALQELDLIALEFLSPLAPGSPLCLGYSSSGKIQEICLKAGQAVGLDYFESIRRGRNASVT